LWVESGWFLGLFLWAILPAIGCIETRAFEDYCRRGKTPPGLALTLGTGRQRYIREALLHLKLSGAVLTLIFVDRHV